MLQTNLIELINSGRMWAFIGSGVSADGGAPTWSGLVEGTLARLDAGLRANIDQDGRYRAALSDRRYEECLGRVEVHAGREWLEQAVAEELRRAPAPGPLARLLADWPFAGYITTNYDSLLEVALAAHGEPGGWLPVGNAPEEVKKLSGEPERVIWHIHGAIDLPKDKSQLILTDRDYDQVYLDGSPIVSQLRGLLAQRRVVFIGFGFNDPELQRLLRIVGRLCNPARPAFAFVEGLSGRKHDAERMNLRDKYNIDALPYCVEDGSHAELLEILEAHGALILRRTLRFGQPELPCPSYDPEVTGLLLYNEVVLGGEARPAKEVLEKLLTARVLSLLKHRASRTAEELYGDSSERIRLLGGDPLSSMAPRSTIEKVIETLVRSGNAQVALDESGHKRASLTQSGLDLVSTQAGTAQRLADQFLSSLEARARQHLPAAPGAANRVARAADLFLKDCVQRRALGVAMAWNPSLRAAQQEYHMVALLQNLPQFMMPLQSREEARPLVRLVIDVLARPSQAELQYLGLLLQAQFGVHLLGYDPDTLRARAEQLRGTLFLIDSSTLIPFLARSSGGYHAARLLLDRLKEAGAIVATTDMLIEETAEHARWPIEARVVADTGHITPETLRAEKGDGYRENAFLSGFVHEASEGRSTLNYITYLESICRCSIAAGRASDAVFTNSVRSDGIQCINLPDLEGFTRELWHERDQKQQLIAQKRKEYLTYRRERQVAAEAEALIVIQGLRERTLRLPQRDLADAYFVSHTRIIDTVAGSGLPVTMRPEAVLQWLMTITSCSLQELSYLTSGLLWELSERGFAVFDTRRLQTVFSPLINASKEQRAVELERHRALISQRYGEDAEAAFRDTPDLDLPGVMRSYYAQKAEELEAMLALERKSKEAAVRKAALSEAERSELEKLRSKQREKRLRAQRKKRAAAIRKGKGQKK